MNRSPQAAARDAAIGTESFVRMHQGAIWRYIRLLGAQPVDADDLVQETFLAFLRKALPQRSAMPLLRTIARGLWIDRQRWLARRRAVEWAEQLDAALAKVPGDTHFDGWLDALAACRKQLGERPQRALELAYRDGLTRGEVARELGLAPNTARNLLASTRKVLRECIEQRMTNDDD